MVFVHKLIFSRILLHSPGTFQKFRTTLEMPGNFSFARGIGAWEMTYRKLNILPSLRTG